MNLENKTVLITGASSGIGAALALEAAKKGARVIMIARNESLLRAQLNRVAAYGKDSCYYTADLSDPRQVLATAETILTDRGCPDVIINNAGSGQWKPVQDTSPEEALAMMQLPYLAAFGVTSAFLPSFMERRSGTILNITSAGSFLTWGGASAYIAARWAIRGFTDAMRRDLKDSGIKVTLAVFAKVSSTYWANNPGSEEKLPRRQSWIPTLSPEQVARHVIKGVEQEKDDVIQPWILRMLLFWGAVFPGLVK